MAYQFKIKLEGIKKPPVWRRLIVPEDITFERFHMIIQAAFGWMDCHLYKFGDKPYHGSLEIKGTEETDDDTIGFDAELYAALGICPRKTMRADETKLADIFGKGTKKLTYLYDFGDDWVHTITLEDTVENIGDHAVCTAGKGACPPEDCGGPYGYENLKQMFEEEPDSKEADEQRRWLGLDADECFDAKYFDLEETNEMLKEV